MHTAFRTPPILPALAALFLAASAPPAAADVSLNNMFGEHMVLQRGIRNRVWGRASPGEAVAVSFANQTHRTAAAANGTWEIQLDPVEEYGGPHVLEVRGNNTLRFGDVMVGEVWVCSGQSNMEWIVQLTKDSDLEAAAARFPNIRMLRVPRFGSQEPQWNFNGTWQVCSPQTVGAFSAVGYFFGRQIHLALGVPVGLVNNSWGGSAAEAWVRRDRLERDERFKPLIERWVKMEANLEADRAAFAKSSAIADWEAAVAAAKAEGRQPPPKPLSPDEKMAGNARPGNAHSGMLSPSIGYGIRGVIWYQGESNAGRAHQYRDLFPLLIRSWREEWGLGDFPFYWVQLADFKAESAEPAESDWAELREAQTMTVAAVPNTAQAVAIDLGEGKDIHPRNKQDVANRLARLALAETYRVPGIASRSPQFRSMEKQGAKLLLAFDFIEGGWRPFDVATPLGFTVAGADRKFVRASARLLPDHRVEVWADAVPDPVAARYAWADNPVCNMYSAAGLPLTPFRTDTFPGKTEGKH